MFLVHNRLCPDYLSDTVLQISDDPGRQRLRKGDGTDYDEPRTRTKMGDRAFSVAAGPKMWNSLPESNAQPTALLDSNGNSRLIFLANRLSI